MELVQHTESDAWLALSLATHLNLLPLSRQLSCITGYPWSRTLQACPSSSRPRARSHWAEKASPSPQVRRGRIRVPSPASPRLSLFSDFGFWGEAFSRSGKNLDTAKGSQEKYPWRG